MLIYILAWSIFIQGTAVYGTDFISFYTAGRIVRLGQPQELFNLDIQRSIQKNLEGDYYFSGGSNLSQHPPYLAPLLALISIDDFKLAFTLWTFVRILIWIACGWIIFNLLRRNKFDSLSTFFASAGFLLFYPLFLSILAGQDTIFILLGLLLWQTGIIESNAVKTGLGLAWSTLSPTIAGPLGLALVSSRRKASVWFFLGCSSLFLFTLAFIRIGGIIDFINLMKISSTSSEFGLNPESMYNFLGFLLRTFPKFELTAARQTAWVAEIVSTLIIVLLWIRNRQVNSLFIVNISIVLAVFFSPHLHIHSTTFLLLPAINIMIRLRQKNWTNGLTAVSLYFVPVISILQFMSAFLPPSIGYSIYYFELILILIISIQLYQRETVHNFKE